VTRKLRIGSRGSDLALWQARYVAARVPGGADIVVIKTRGDAIQHLSLDKIEGKGFFSREIEAALLANDVDIAVHSYKDLPTEETAGLAIAAVPERAPVHDVIVAKAGALGHQTTTGLARHARVGTSSIRRKAQLAATIDALETVDLRGNVPTRVRKVEEGELDAVVLAEAGLARLGIIEAALGKGLVVKRLPLEVMTPAAAQGALAIQIRADDAEARAGVAVMNDVDVRRAVNVERALLARFGGGCHLPLGVSCRAIDADTVELIATITSPDGSDRLGAHTIGDEAKVVEEAHATLVTQGALRYL
jgi:hydroxymethylbilane synthase